MVNGILASRYCIKQRLPLLIMKLKLSKINQKHNFVITVVEDVREHVLEKLLKQRKFKTMQHLLTLTFLRTKICQI